MGRTVVILAAAAMLAGATQADAQGRGNRQDRRDRQEIARAQGVPPGQMPPPNQCRVWYDDRSPGRQPSPTNCNDAERIATRDRNARVIYGTNVYNDRYAYGANNPTRDRNNDRGVYRVPGRNRDPRVADPYDPYYRPRKPNGDYVDPAVVTTQGFKNGYRDGLEKGREDADDNDRYDLNRHDWYRSADRGRDDDKITKAQYQRLYREGFEAGYSEAYRAVVRR
jgi:hypothetical protein